MIYVLEHGYIVSIVLILQDQLLNFGMSLLSKISIILFRPKVGNDYQFLLKSVSKIADSLYLMFKNTDFKFSIGDPTARIDNDTVLLKRR